MIGRTVGRYKIIDQLGEGGMGSVWKAEDTTLGRLVALKTISGTLADDPEARERFVREAQAASALNHPNITTVHDLLEEDGEHLICMEYVEGKTVRDMVESGRVGVKKAVDIILQVAEALETAHRKGILHRDIKSSNIMVTMEGRVKVLDFGLVHLEERSQLTRTGTTLGTLSYSSPEQLTGGGYDERSEVWSLGVVLYEMLTGRLPFSSPSEGELVFAIINNEQEPPTRFREDLPESVGRILLRMLEKDPAERYQGCSEVIADLRTARGDLETTRVEPATIGKARRRRVRLAITVPALLALIALAVLYLNARSSFVEGSALVIQFQDWTRDESLEAYSRGGPEQIRQVLSESGLVNGVDIHWLETGAGRSPLGQPLTSTEILSTARSKKADIVITSSYRLEGDELVFQPTIFSRSRDDSWALPEVRGPSSDPATLLKGISDRVEGMTACIRDDQYRVLAPLIGFPPSYGAYQSFREGMHEFFLGGLSIAMSKIESVAEAYPDYSRPLLWLARWAIWVGDDADFDRLLAEIDRRGLELDTQEQAFRELMQFNRANDREASYRAAVRLQQLAPGTYWNYEAGKWATQSQRPRQAVEFLTSYFPEADLLRNSTNATRFMLSLAYHKLGMHEQAFHTVNELGELDLRRSLYYEVLSLGALGDVDGILGRFEEAKGQSWIDRNLVYPVCIPSSGENPGHLLSAGGVRLREYGHVEESRLVLHRAIEWYSDTDASLYKASIAEAHYWAEEWEAAAALYRDVAAERPESLEVLARMGTIAARLGDETRARAIYAQLTSQDVSNPRVLFFTAGLAALLGEKDAAVVLVRSALDNGLNWRDDIKLNIDLESLRGYPNFEAIFELKG
ncbi:protein kinase [Gemmatimonadota bacterium]